MLQTLVAMKDRQQLEKYRSQLKGTAPEQAIISEYLKNSVSPYLPLIHSACSFFRFVFVRAFFVKQINKEISHFFYTLWNTFWNDIIIFLKCHYLKRKTFQEKTHVLPHLYCVLFVPRLLVFLCLCSSFIAIWVHSEALLKLEPSSVSMNKCPFTFEVDRSNSC